MLQSSETINSANKVFKINLVPQKKEKPNKKINKPRISSIIDEIENNLSNINSNEY